MAGDQVRIHPKVPLDTARNRTERGCWVVAHRTTRLVVRVRYSTTTVGHH